MDMKHVTYTGRAYAISTRTDFVLQDTVWAFRLALYDSEGRHLRSVDVELRGRYFRGRLYEGDWVSVQGKPRGGVLVASRITNLETRSTVRARFSYMKMSLAGFAIFLAAVAAMLALLLPSMLGRGPTIEQEIRDAGDRAYAQCLELNSKNDCDRMIGKP